MNAPDPNLILILATSIYLGRLWLRQPLTGALDRLEALEDRESSLSGRVEAAEHTIKVMTQEMDQAKAKANEAHELAVSTGAALLKVNNTITALNFAVGAKQNPLKDKDRGR